MMSPLPFNDETLMAFADGELDADTARAVQAAAQTDSRVAQRIALFRGTAQMVRNALPNPAPEVPEALRASVQAAIARAKTQRLQDASLTEQPANATRPVNLPDSRAHAAPSRPAANQSYWALAATVASVAVGVLAFLAGRYSAPDTTLALAAPAGIVLTADTSQLQQWRAALSQLPSGQERELKSQAGSARMAMLASFRDSSGALCREFSWTTARQPIVAGVACQDAGASGMPDWRLAYAAEAIHVQGGYSPASASSALDAYVRSIGGGPILDEAQEREALGATARR